MRAAAARRAASPVGDGTDLRPVPPQDPRPASTRSPVYVLALAAGLVVVAAGWAVATLFQQTVIAFSVDAWELVDRFPASSSAPEALSALGTFGALVLVHAWLLGRRSFRRLLLVEVALVAGFALSLLGSRAVLAVLTPEVRDLFDDLPEGSARVSPTSPAVAALAATLTMVRQWVPPRRRAALYAGLLALSALNLVLTGPPYLGVVLDPGIGMVAGSLVALVLTTPNLQPDPAALVEGLTRSGVHVASLQRAAVDARGSEPWLGTTTDGQAVFVKALSSDQRAADLLFRAVRSVRLRRTGDAPPEVSLQRAAEHEALVSHHVRSLGIATPRLLAVADVGNGKVALAYEAIAGRSLDKVDVATVTDEVLAEIWGHVRELRARAVAHRDLRLANVFVADGGHTMLIDFSFAELAASQQLLDADVAELLAATSMVVGAPRAVRVALEVVGRDALEGSRDWLHPLAFSSATRAAVTRDGDLQALRDAVDHATGHTATEYEPLGRFTIGHVLAVVLTGVGLYSLLALALDERVAELTDDLELGLAAAAAGVGAAVPFVSAAGFRWTVGRRISYRVALGATFAAGTPVASPTAWSFGNRVLSDAARADGVQTLTAKRAAAAWTIAGLVSGPLLVAGFSTAALRVTHGYLHGIGRGLVLGLALAAVVVLLLVASPFARELVRVWLRPYRSTLPGVQIAGAVLWWAGERTVYGLAFALAARAAGVDADVEALVAVAVAASTLASLLPAPGGMGAVELFTYLGLLNLGAEPAPALLATVVARTATFWLHLPLALTAYRSTRHYRLRTGHTGT